MQRTDVQPQIPPSCSQETTPSHRRRPQSPLEVLVCIPCIFRSSLVAYAPDTGKNLTLAAALDRVRAFLPVMAEANANLEKNVEEHGQEKYDIEAVDEDGAAIVMDLSVVTEESLRAPPSNLPEEDESGDAEADSSPR